MSDDPTPEEFADPANWHPIEEHPYLNDPPNDPPMSDLRDRIAAVLYGNLRRQQGIDRPDRFKDWIDTRELADAVIEALGLKLVRRYGFHRHVTEWEIDE